MYSHLFGPVNAYATEQEFIVKPGETVPQIASALHEAGLIKSPFAFRLADAKGGAAIRPGGYKLSGNEDVWSVVTTLQSRPYLSFVTVPIGLRKEQIADILADSLGWTLEEKQEWITIDTETPSSFTEGVYFPGTYLIPADLAPLQVATLMQSRFEDAFAPYAREAEARGVSWTDALTIASMIQREAGSVSDMSLISGIIYNRLKEGMPLAIDATLQYMEGSEDGGWWPVPKSAKTYPDTAFNTYKHAGLPPHPIANPGLAAIEAAVNPDETNCLFYIHDTNGQMHCSQTYAGQVKNVNTYLK